MLVATTAALAAPSDNTLVVRAFDTASGLEETNTEARVHLVVDPDGRDVSARPNAPHALAVPAAIVVGADTWVYVPVVGGLADLFYLARGLLVALADRVRLLNLMDTAPRRGR